MKGFNFEKDLLHQKHAVESTVAVFKNLCLVAPSEVDKNYINPTFEWENDVQYKKNIEQKQYENAIKEPYKKSNIIDIMMETGICRTYTYTKTIFELNKSEKSFIPPAVSSFVNAGNFEKNSIQVMIINAGMINSETMQMSFDKGLFDKYNIPFDAIAATKPFMIIDEPHNFTQSNKTWDNLQKMKPQSILRYGATFQGYENLIYTLTAFYSFNRNLIKGDI